MNRDIHRDTVTNRDTELLTERDKRDTTLWVSRCHGRLSRHGRFSGFLSGRFVTDYSAMQAKGKSPASGVGLTREREVLTAYFVKDAMSDLSLSGSPMCTQQFVRGAQRKQVATVGISHALKTHHTQEQNHSRGSLWN